MNTSQERDGFVRKHATSLATALFAVVAATGLMLLFHLGDAAIKPIHEWLGVLFVAAALLHVVRNGGAFRRLLVQPRTLVVCGVVLAATAALGTAASLEDGHGVDPSRAVAGLVVRAPLAQVATLMQEPVDTVVARLGAIGIQGASATKPLSQIAAENGTDLRRVLAAAMPSR